MTEAVIEKRTGHCWRCGAPFAPGELITLVRDYFLRRLLDGTIYRSKFAEEGTMCPRCTTPEEAAAAPYTLNCYGCGLPMATPHGHYSFERKDRPSHGTMSHKVCSDRCMQRWRRQRQAAQRGAQLVICAGCGEGFEPSRSDARFCSNACRQSTYRRRKVTGEPAVRPKPVEGNVFHLDDIAGVLHYGDIPILALDRLPPSWQGYGNRYVRTFPRFDEAATRDAARRAGLSIGYWDHLFECRRCRRWSVARGYTYCSRACRLADRAEEVRERRAG